VRAAGAAPTGLFFAKLTCDALIDEIDRFEALPAGTFDPHACRANAERFCAARFRSSFSPFVLEGYAALQGEMGETMQDGPREPGGAPDG
ncbi:glycosyltransferase family 4 protein, partial [Burkholderia pseudomallei]